jgi:alkyldihydroxyacetonephosphate synthase
MDGRVRSTLQSSAVDPKIIKEFTGIATDICGEKHVSLNMADLLANSRDYWPVTNLWMLDASVPALPQVVVWPGSTAEVSKLLVEANKLKIPVTPYGEGSGTLGGAIPLKGGISLDLKRMNKICAIDETNLQVTVESGLNGAHYEEQLNRNGYSGGHFPQSLRCSSVGGWLSCRAAGQFSTRYGKIEDIVVALEAVLPDGTVFRGRSVPRTATGPRVDHLFVGAEGTLGVITSATLRIWPLAEKRHLSSYTFASFEDAIEAIRLFMRDGARPAVVRLYDAQETGNHFPTLGDKNPILVLLIEGAAEIVEAENKVVTKHLLAKGAESCGSEHVEHWLEKRFDVSVASRLFQKGAVLDTIEVTTNWHNAHSTYLAMQEALLAVEGTMIASGHYSHVYSDGAALYMTTVGFPGEDKISYYKKIWQAAMSACINEEAAISHHHGIGLHRGLWMREEHGTGLDVLKRIKQALDPEGIMNPGKLGLEEVETWQK